MPPQAGLLCPQTSWCKTRASRTRYVFRRSSMHCKTSRSTRSSSSSAADIARLTKTAWDVHTEGRGVCRDFAHLAVTLCRCMNIPARYCTGYLGDIGVPPDPAPMDFSAWFEAYLGDGWYTFDARTTIRVSAAS